MAVQEMRLALRNMGKIDPNPSMITLPLEDMRR